MSLNGTWLSLDEYPLILCLLMQNDPAAVLQGEKEAEKMIVEAYSALLLAFLSTERWTSYWSSVPFV